MKKKISIIIPVFRNSGTLHKTYVGIKYVLKTMSEFDHEIIFINDGSDDNSLNELLEIRNVDKKVKIIDFTRNFGQVAANYAGFEHAKGDLLIHVSADLQDPLTLIAQMVKKWEEGFKIVAGARVDREDGFISKITSKIFYSIIKVSIPKIPSGGFDFYLVDKIVYKKVLDFNEKNSFLQGDLLWTGYEPYFINYKRQQRKIGKSQWSLAKKIKYFVDGVINTSYLPIRLMSFAGLGISVVGFLYAAVVFLARIFNGSPFKGYAPIMIVLLVTSGLIMCMLGIIGEYLWRIYDEVRQRPRYIVKKRYF